MRQYYYFVSSLPSLWMDKEAPLSYSDFLQVAKEQLSKSDFNDLKLATFHPEGESKLQIVKDWEAYIHKVNEFLTEARARKLGLDFEKEYKANCLPDKALEDKIKAIVEVDNPLEAERALLALYFDFLSTYEGSDPFSAKALMVYGLKLQILERSASFNRDKGKAEFDKLFNDVQKDIFHKE